MVDDDGRYSGTGRVKITERGRPRGGELPSVPCAWAACVVCALALAGGTCACATRPHAEKAGRPSPQLVLARAVRATGFPFSATQTVFSDELLPAFAQQWAREGRTLLGPTAARQGQQLLESSTCTSWSSTKPERDKLRALVVHLSLPFRRESVAVSMLRFQVLSAAAGASGFRKDDGEGTLELSVCARIYRGSLPKLCAGHDDDGPWMPLIKFEGTPREGTGFQKIMTHRENLMEICAVQAPALSFVDMAEILARVPILPASWVDIVRARVLEDAASEAAWEDGDSGGCLSATGTESDPSTLAEGRRTESSHSFDSHQC